MIVDGPLEGALENSREKGEKRVGGQLCVPQVPKERVISTDIKRCLKKGRIGGRTQKTSRIGGAVSKTHW